MSRGKDGVRRFSLTDEQVTDIAHAAVFKFEAIYGQGSISGSTDNKKTKALFSEIVRQEIRLKVVRQDG